MSFFSNLSSLVILRRVPNDPYQINYAMSMDNYHNQQGSTVGIAVFTCLLSFSLMSSKLTNTSHSAIRVRGYLTSQLKFPLFLIILFHSRPYPVHDSAQILSVRNSNYKQEINRIKDYYVTQHQNWCEVDAMRSKWWVSNKMTEEARASINQIQTYLENIKKGTVFPFYFLFRHWMLYVTLVWSFFYIKLYESEKSRKGSVNHITPYVSPFMGYC